MKRIIVIFIIGLIILEACFAAPSSSNESVKAYTKTIKLKSITRTANVVQVDLNDENIRIEAGIANDKIRTVEDFKEFIDRKKPLAVINANFFAAYSDFSPVGTIATDHNYLWSAFYGTSVGFSGDNEVAFYSVA